MNLTPEQQTAARCPDNLLITACPGSGKTRVIIARLLGEIDRLRGTPKTAACITYTNTAVQEIEHRTAQFLEPGDERHFTVSTIHAFCLNAILRPFGWLAPGFNSALKVITRDHPDFEEIARHAAAQVNYHNLDHWDYDAFSNLALDAQGNIVGVAAGNAAVRRAAPYYWRRCDELGFVDFGRILYTSYCLLHDHPFIVHSVATRYPAFLVDEFQDTSELQVEILKLVHAHGNCRLFAVGDPAQSIYGFAGARPELAEPFAEHVGARTDLTLTGNFRSSGHVVDQAERLLPRHPRMQAVGPNRNDPQVPLLVSTLDTFHAITEAFLPKLQELAIPLGDAAILAREWGPLFDLSRRLRAFGTPIVGPGARPYRRSRLFASLAEQLCAYTASPLTHGIRQLENALFHAVLDATAEARLEVYAYDGRIALTRMMREARRLAEQGGAVRWLDDMSRATAEILLKSGFVDANQARLFFASVQEMKADMLRQGVDLDNLTIDDLGMFANPQAALRLGTIFFAKGREYKAVALINMREGKIPNYRARDAAALADERRILYVGLTRAERLLMYVAEPGEARSRFLTDLGFDLSPPQGVRRPMRLR